MSKRKEDRKTLALDAKFKAQHDRRDVLIADLSRHGCRLVSGNFHLSAGQTILLRPQGLESLAAVVRWSLDGAVGVEFETPLHPAVVDHLCRLHPDSNAVITLDLAA